MLAKSKFIFLFLGVISLSIGVLYAKKDKPNIYSYSPILKQKYLNDMDKFPKVRFFKGKDYVPPHFSVGDTKNFWCYNVSQGGQYIVGATCRAVGNDCYIFAEDESWNNGKITQATVDAYYNAFENSTPNNPDSGIFQIETTHFGPMPDQFDNDPRLYILILDIKDGWTHQGQPYVGGFFDPLNQMSNAETQWYYGMYSNEIEMFYVDCYPTITIEGVMTLSHEFNHLLQWGCDREEELWIDEGLAQYASRVTGYAPENYFVNYFAEFENFPQTSLVDWYYDDPGGVLPDYEAIYLFLIYCSEQVNENFVFDLFKDQLHGIKSIENLLVKYDYPYTWNELLHNWGIANYIDVADSNFFNGLYGYNSIDVGLQKQRFKSSAAVQEYPVTSQISTINTASAYIRFMLLPDAKMNFFKDDNNLSVSLIVLDSDLNVKMIKNNIENFISIDSLAYVTYSITGSDEVIAVITNPFTNDYNFAFRMMPDGVIHPNNTNENRFMLYPNPANNKLIFQWKNDNHKEILLMSETGKRMYHGYFTNELLEINVSNWANGVYYYYIRFGENKKRGNFVVEH